jgi:hypothetical protein
MARYVLSDFLYARSSQVPPPASHMRHNTPGPTGIHRYTSFTVSIVNIMFPAALTQEIFNLITFVYRVHDSFYVE